MKSTRKRILCALLTAALALTGAWLLPVGGDGGGAGESAYAAAATPKVGDTVYFGRYPQGLYDSKKTVRPSTGAENVDWVSQKVNLFESDYTGDYTEIFGDPPNNSIAYYKVESIAWRVLENAGGKLFLMAEKALDAKPYHTDDENVTWETSTIRSWLNGYGASSNAGGSDGTDYTSDNFIGKAFNAGEKNAISTAAVQNPNNGTVSGGNPTNDKVFLLSLQEVTNTSYGFSSSYSEYDTKRQAQTTPFARAHYAGASTDSYYFGNGWWWLRSPGSSSYGAAYVSYDGYADSSGTYVDNSDHSVRPALFLNLESITFTSTGSNAWTAAVSLGGATVTCSPSTAVYTGNPITPAVTVQLGGQTLAPGTHYTLSYSNNTNPGTATVTATAKPGSGYAGSASTTFTITPISIAAATVTCTPGTAEYTGSPITPAVTVTLGGRTLMPGTDYDYTLSFANNTNPGTATVTATAVYGSGYSGSASATFTITKKPDATKLKAPTKLTLTAKKKSLLVKWTKPTEAAKQQLTGYKIRYRYKTGKTWSKWKTKTVKISYKATAKTAKNTVKKLKSGKTYQVQIRSYKITGKGKAKQQYYSKWTKGKKKRVY